MALVISPTRRLTGVLSFMLGLMNDVLFSTNRLIKNYKLLLIKITHRWWCPSDAFARPLIGLQHQLGGVVKTQFFYDPMAEGIDRNAF